jgi:arylsulfatase
MTWLILIRITLTISLLTGICLPGSNRAGKPAPVGPNVVLFFVDDLGYGDLSCTGALGYTTPNIDRMAAEGIRFTNFLVAQAVCSASRAALLTGCYPNRVGMSGALGPASPVGLHPNEETIAELLKEKGYATGIFGKWHLGDQQPFLPLQHGFDEYYGVPYSHDMWPLHPNQANAKYPPLPLLEGNRPVKQVQTLGDAAQLTSAFTERAVRFIEKHKNEPFFLYVPHPMPHVPLAASGKFRGQTQRGLYGDVVSELDWSVGQVLKALKKNGLDQKTLVIFTSDNGPWLNYGEHAGSSGGFREGKGTSYEGGHRVPCIIRWPGVVPPGSINNKLLTTLDILPTVAKVCAARLPKNRIDGVDVTRLLKGDQQATPRKEFFYYYRRNSLEAVRQGEWKLVFAHPGRTYEGFLPGQNGQPGPNAEEHPAPAALYHLGRDPGERYDVAVQHPDVVAALEKLAERARQDMGDDLRHRPGSNRRPAGGLTHDK